MSHDNRLREIADRVLWLEDGQFSQVAAMAIDPVCRMQVEAAGPTATWNGHRWWFCSNACRQEFLSDPERFTTTTGPLLDQVTGHHNPRSPHSRTGA